MGPRYNGTRMYYFRGVFSNKSSHELILLSQRHKRKDVFVGICGNTFPSVNKYHLQIESK